MNIPQFICSLVDGHLLPVLFLFFLWPITLHPYHLLIMSEFLIFVNLIGRKWYFIVVLSYISLITSEVELIFKYLLNVQISS